MNDQPSININLSNIPDVQCEKCQNNTFEQAFIIKKLSALTSPTGKEGMVPITTFACMKCGHINKEFLPTSAQQEDRPPADNGGIQSSKLSLIE